MSLDNPLPLAIKGALAATLAYLLCRALSLPDGLSAAFVAVVCVTPTVLAGLRRAVGQGLGSALGGALAAGLMVTGMPTAVSLGLSVGGAVLAVHAAGFGRAHTVAAFTAIYVHLLPLGDPGQTLGIRVWAIAVGALSAMTVNVAVSAMFYERIFARRLVKAAQTVAQGADGIANGNLAAMVPAFALLSGLSAELAQADKELQWRRNTELAIGVQVRRKRVRALLRVAHFAHDLGLAVDESGTSLTGSDIAALRHTATTLRGKPGSEPTADGEITMRLLAALRRYLEDGASGDS